MRRLILALLGLLLLTGCAGGAPTAAGAPAEVSIRITLTDGKVEPSGERVPAAKGTTLVLTIESDHEDKIHVHGYDLEIPVGAGETVTKEILLDKVGRFEVESHEPVLTILQLIVS